MNTLHKSAGAFLLAFFCLLLAGTGETPAASFDRQVFPLQHNNHPIHLERTVVHGTTPTRQILLLHGLTYSSHIFDVNYRDYSLVRHLAREGFAVWQLDFAGYGDSTPVYDGFLVDTAFAAQEVALAFNIIQTVSGAKKVDILAFNWGTMVAAAFAVRHPDRTDRLVFYSPLLRGLGKATVTEPFNALSWEMAAGEFQLGLNGEIDPKIYDMAAANTFLAECWHHDQDTSPNGGRREVLVDESVKLIPTEKIKNPTLLVFGSQDPYVSQEAAREAIADLNADSRLVVIPGAGHLMMLEAPYYETFRDVVLGFLNRGDTDK